jgi:hypothetical protein
MPLLFHQYYFTGPAMVAELLKNVWLVFLDTAFWLLIGLLAAGLIKSFISEDTMRRWAGGNGIASILRAALFGAPLPLCSCGVLPAAIGLRRAGASKEATVSFLVSTPETSVDSVAVTYALMGPVMAVVRPVAALINAVGTGLLTALLADKETAGDVTSSPVESSCCSSTNQPAENTGTDRCSREQARLETVAVTSSCCDSKPGQAIKSCCTQGVEDRKKSNKILKVISYAGAELLDDISKWMAFGIVMAGIMLTFIPPDWLSQWGGGLSAMLVMLVVGIPMYICAVASTPVAAGLLLAGVSPGAVLVFLLVGPATNISSFALLRMELGMKVTLVYLVGLSVLSVMTGLLLDWLLPVMDWEIHASLGEAHAMLPGPVSWISALVLLFLAIKPLRRIILPQLG